MGARPRPVHTAACMSGPCSAGAPRGPCPHPRTPPHSQLNFERLLNTNKDAPGTPSTPVIKPSTKPEPPTPAGSEDSAINYNAFMLDTIMWCAPAHKLLKTTINASDAPPLSTRATQQPQQPAHHAPRAPAHARCPPNGHAAAHALSCGAPPWRSTANALFIFPSSPQDQQAAQRAVPDWRPAGHWPAVQTPGLQQHPRHG